MATVRVENGSNTVRHIHQANYTDLASGPYTSGEAVTWDGGGVGVVVEDQSSLQVLKLYRTSGPLPAAGDTLTGGSSGATSEVVSMIEALDFTAFVTQGDVLLIQNNINTYQISATINEDNFDLVESYGEATRNDTQYQIANNSSPFFGWLKPIYGMRARDSLLAKTIQDIENELKRYNVAEAQVSSSSGAVSFNLLTNPMQGITLTEDVTNITLIERKDSGLCVLRFQQDGTGGHSVTGWPSNVRWNGVREPVVAEGADEQTLMILYYDSATDEYIGSVAQGWEAARHVATPAGLSTEIDWSKGNHQSLLLNAAIEVDSFIDPPVPTLCTLRILQDGAGGRPLDWDEAALNLTWIGGGELNPPQPRQASNAVTLYFLYFDGTNWYGYSPFEGSGASMFAHGNFGSTPTINWSTGGRSQTGTLNANAVFSFTDPEGPGECYLEFIQDGTGGRTVTWPSEVKWNGGTEPTWNSGAGVKSLVKFYFDGVDYLHLAHYTE